MAFVVSPIVGSLSLNGWHLGLASADGTIAGFYSAQTDPRCYVHDFAWRPDEKGIVVEPAGCGGVGRLALLTPDAKVVFEVPTQGVKGLLYISPDSLWAALVDGARPTGLPYPPGPTHEKKQRTEFISLENPDIRLDLPVSGMGGLYEWLERVWVRGQSGAAAARASR